MYSMNLSYEVQEQARPIYGDRDQNNGFLWETINWEWAEGSPTDRNVLYLDQGGPHGDVYICTLKMRAPYYIVIFFLFHSV